MLMDKIQCTLQWLREEVCHHLFLQENTIGSDYCCCWSLSLGVVVVGFADVVNDNPVIFVWSMWLLFAIFISRMVLLQLPLLL